MSDQRAIRIFLSSTFRDFGEERDLLVKRVFPALRAKLKDRFVELVDVDLRWGITVEEAERGEVLPICLAEIDRSPLYFIGMLGERYGWIPPHEGYAPDLLERQPWLKKHQGSKSVTELEVLHGVLNNRRMKGRAFFYFRSATYAKQKGGDYVPASPEDRQRQVDLKRRIKASGYPVTAYRDPQSLAKRLERDLWNLLDAEFPATSVPDAFERERLRHEAYAAPRRRLYLGGERYQAQLAVALEAGEQRIVIEGASGGGKSALLANFFESYRKRHPRHPVHEHYLGASADAGDPHALVSRLAEFIKRQTHSSEEIESDPQKLMGSLPQWLDTAGAWARKHKTRFVFVLDALNSLTDQQDLRWWPGLLPQAVHFVVSCLPGPVLQALKDKAQGLQGQRPRWKIITVKPLTKVERKNLLTAYLARYKKTLPKSLTAQVMAHTLSGNPLFIRTLAEELRLFGVHEQLTERLTHYLKSQTIDDLFEKVIERVEGDCSKKAVKATLTAIWASRAGLTEKEILGIANLKPAEWALIRNALDEGLLEADGKITFSHEYVRRATGDRYVTVQSTRIRLHRMLAAYLCREGDSHRRAEEEPWHLNAAGAVRAMQVSLQDPGVFLGLWNRRPEELLGYWKSRWSRERLPGDYERAYPRWMTSAPHAMRQPLMVALARAFWEHGCYSRLGGQLQREACSATVRRFGAKSLEAARQFVECAGYLRQLADPQSIRYAEKAVAILKDQGPSLDLAEALTVLAAVLDADGRGWESRSRCVEALALLEDLPGSQRRHLTKHDVVMTALLTAYPSEAFRLLEPLVRDEEEAFGGEDRRTLESVDHLVGYLNATERWAEANNLGMSLYLRCYRTFGEDHVQTGYAAGKYGEACLHLDDLVSAEWGLSKAVEILRGAWPKGHPSRTIFHQRLTELYTRMGRPDEAAAIEAELKSGLISRYVNS
jgi:hypothetical protein